MNFGCRTRIYDLGMVADYAQANTLAEIRDSTQKNIA